MTQGDLGGTPFGMIETKRKLGKVKQQSSKPSESQIANDIVWSDQARRQTGYEHAALLKTGIVVLYNKVKPARMKALGGSLPQHDEGMTNAERSRLQGVAMDERREADSHLTFDTTQAVRSVFGG